ncbi:hypothetical protein V8F06_009743 [Rhypophila decipiens]
MVGLKLGIEYLWVDALCILQDDAHDKSVEIANMPNIHRNSTLTIAPASASAVTQGLLAERAYPGNAPAFLLPYRGRAGDGNDSQQVLGNIFLSSAIKETEEPLHTRGWTLQERLLSPRTLEFGTHQTRCIRQQLNPGPCDGWREQAEYSNSRQDRLDLRVLQVNFDSLLEYQEGSTSSSGRFVPGSDEYAEGVDNWSNLVGMYSRRNLTQPTDRILAISGITARYGSILKDQYVCGMWLGTLRSALGWNSESTFGPQAVQRPSAASYQGLT